MLLFLCRPPAVPVCPAGGIDSEEPLLLLLEGGGGHGALLPREGLGSVSCWVISSSVHGERTDSTVSVFSPRGESAPGRWTHPWSRELWLWSWQKKP